MKKVLHVLHVLVVFIPSGGLFAFMTTTTRHLISIEVLPAFAYHWFIISAFVLLLYSHFMIISYLDRKELEKEKKKFKIEIDFLPTGLEIDASEIKACDWSDVLDQCEFKSENGILSITLKEKYKEETK